HGINTKLDGRRRSALEVLAYDDVDFARLAGIWPELADTPPVIAEQMEIEAAYAGYLDRQEADIVAFRKDEDLRIPPDLDYAAIGGLSNQPKQHPTPTRPAPRGRPRHAGPGGPDRGHDPGGHHGRARPSPAGPQGRREGSQRVSWPPQTDEDGFGPEDVIREIRVSRETIFRISEYLRVLGD